MLICFVGIDGSGKTVQAKRLNERLRAEGINSRYTWCRYSPRIMMPFIRAAKAFLRRNKSGVRQSEYREFTSSKRKFLRNPLFGAAWLNLSLLEYLAQVTFKVRPPLILGGTLICDRYLYDDIADLAVGFGRSGEGVIELMRHPLVRVFPVPDRVFFLDVPAGIAIKRKDDPNVMGEEYLRDREEIYGLLSEKLGFTRIDGTLGIDEIAQAVASVALKTMHSKTEAET
jgi:dTMP kinase